MEVVHEQEVRQELVLGRLRPREQPPQRLAVELRERPDRLGRGRVAFDLSEQRLDPSDELARFVIVHYELPSRPSIGEWTRFSVLPLPRYMCTPHGRQGSKLRTVRMMSMPRKFSWPFSSKIFCPSTASS